MNEETARLQADVLAARERAAASAEAVGYRTDVAARAKDAVSDTAETLKSALLQGLTSAKQSAAGAAASVQAAASDVVERTRPAVTAAASAAADAAHAAQTGAQSAIESTQAAVATARAAVETVADGALDRVPPHEGTLPPS